MSGSHNINISTSNLPLQIKFALLCLNKIKTSKWAAYFSFILSHLQTIAIIIKSAYLALPDDTPSASPVIRVILKFLLVGDLINYQNTTPLLVGTSIILLYVLKMLILIIYMHISLALKLRIPALVQYYWSTLHSLHRMLIFFWIHTFCVSITGYPPHYEVVHGIKVSLRAMAFFSTIISCLLALFFSTISLTYKTQDVLSSKTNVLEIKNVLFKILIPSLWRVAENNKRVQMLILVLTLVDAISHDWIFWKNIPYYRVKTLLLSSILQATQTSLALACFITKLIANKEADIGVFTFQLIWIFLLPIAIKSYYNFTWKILLYAFRCEPKNETNISYLVHKRFILLYFLKSRKILHGGIYNLSDADLMYQAKLVKFVRDSGLSFEELDRDKKLLVRCLKATYLEILGMHPKSLLAQINLAHFYSKFESLYLVSNNLLEDALSKGPGYYEELSLNMLRFELQQKMLTQFSRATDEQENEGLDVSHYIINQELLDKVKEGIEKQAEAHINFWNEFLASKPQMQNLMNIALRVRSQKQIVKKHWNDLLKIRAKSFLSPLIVYGKYSSLINNNPFEGGQLLKRAQEESKRLSRHFKIDELSNQTIFSDKTVQITMSGLRSKLGKIIDCSPNIENFFGWQANEMKSRPIIFLMPPFYRQRHDIFLVDHFNTGKTKTLNNTGIYPVKRSNGYIHPTWIHTKVSPVMEKGIFYVGLLRPCKSSQRMVLVRKDGKIDDMSLGFARDMHLEGKECQIECDIFTLCPQFQRINEVFNKIADEIIEKAAVPSSNYLLHTRVTRKRIQETEGNLATLADERPFTQGEAGWNTDRPLISARKRHVTIDTPRSRGPPHESPTTLQEATTINDAEEIYENFMAGGTTLKFYPVDQAEPITYSVKITNNIHDNEVIKFILLEKISGEESVDEKRMAETESSDHEALFPSLKIVDNENEKKKRMTLIKNVFSPSKANLATTSPSIFETEGGELRLITTSPRIRTEPKFEEDQANDVTNLSIGDEVQSNDSRYRKAVFRNFLEENTHSFPDKKQVKIPEIKRQFLEIKSKELHEGKHLQQRKRKLDVDPKEYSLASSSYLYRGKKAEQLMTQALRTEPTKKSAKLYTSLLLFFFVSVISLLSAQSANLSSGIKEVQNQVPVISAAFFRQYNMIGAASQIPALRAVIEGYVILVDWETDNLMFQTYLQEYLSDLIKYNAQFYESLTNLPLEMQSKFYEKNVAFYELGEDRNKIIYSRESFFGSLEMLIERFLRCLYIELPDEWEPGIDTSNHDFIINNALNDLLVQSQFQIDQLTKYFDESTNSTTLKSALIMGGVLFACLIFILVSIRYLCLSASEMRIFMTMIFRMQTRDCEAIKLTLENFQAWLKTDLKDQELLITKVSKRQDARNHNSLRFRTASMGSFYRSQRLVFLKLLPILFFSICWSLVYFFLTSNFIGNIHDSKKRMEASLQALNNQTLFVNELVSMPLTNSTVTIINEPLMPRLNQSLQYLEEISAFIDWFKDRKGNLTPLQQKILFGFNCEDLAPYVAVNYVDYNYAYGSCFVVGKGTDKIGLVDLNSQFYDAGMYIIAMYEASNKTLEELGEIFVVGVSMANDLVNSAEGFLILLYTATYESFEDEVDSIKESSLALTIAIVIVTVVAIVVTWYSVIIKIFKAQKIDWYILQIIPIELIRSNKHLQQYLLKSSNGMLDGVKSVLS